MSIEQAAQNEIDAKRHLKPVDLSALAGCAIDPTHYAIDRILPCGHVTLMGSHGGAGKSVLAETLAAHVGTGTPWAGLPSTHGKTVFVSLEDPGELARFRLRRICDAYDLSPVKVAENMMILDGSNSDSILAVEMAIAGTRSLAFTDAMTEIETAAEGCRLLVIDNASDAFAGNENERQLVRAFIRRLAHIARKHDCAVLLLAHIDKAAARHGSNGNSYSGSTAWHNTVRSRLALIEEDVGCCLVQEKLNLDKKIDPIRLEWTDTGVLVPLTATGSAATEREDRDSVDVLAAVQAAIADGATIHAARSGPCSTLTVLKTYPDLPGTLRKDKARFWSALTRLEREGTLVRERYKNSHRHDRERLIVRADLRAAPIPIPLRIDARTGRADASVVRQSNRRGTGALAQCLRCDGAGCQWCKKPGAA